MERVKGLRVNPKNPRKITDARLLQLAKSMAEFGDISGIVHNRRSGNLLGGNQRSRNLDETSKVVITKRYEKPTSKGTVATGYILHEGERFSFREVDWDEDTETAAMIAANKNAGDWDKEILGDHLKHLSSFDVDFDLKLTMFEPHELLEFGINPTTTVSEHERSLLRNDDEQDEGEPEPPEEPEKLLGEIQIIQSDCLEAMRAMPENSVDSIVTDPPYGWRFMGKSWDGEDIDRMAQKDLGEEKVTLYSDGKMRKRKLRPAQAAGKYDLSDTGNSAFQKFSEEWAKEALRVLKPGGHALIFCGPRTYHRMASGVEDAGFEVRDQLQWLFGSGFPKSLDISKAIDRAAGAEREVTGQVTKARKPGSNNSAIPMEGLGTEYKTWDETPKPATAAAAAWEGWGTALKPANEPILLARKPLSEKTVAANVLKWGTGGLNIDECRIEGAPRTTHKDGNKITNSQGMFTMGESGFIPSTPTGRFPANLVLDETAAEMLDAQSGESKSQIRRISPSENTAINNQVYGKGYIRQGGGQNDTGGASRFFYIAKSSKSERNMHCGELEEIEHDSAALLKAAESRESKNKNHHPTVKPVSLMRYLVRLVTPQNGIILDPFMGSGTTGVAALQLQFRFIGTEREAEYFEICKKRLNAKKNQTEVVSTPKKTVTRKKG